MNHLLQDGAAASQTVGVIGAGTMGAGIAQVAAAAGHPVKLMDVRPGAAQAAIAQIAKGLATLVDKGRQSEPERAATLSRLSAAAALTDMADAALVVEVIVENLDAKQTLMRDLEAIVSPQAVLASNTSSISITAIASGLQAPQRVLGMHFFNPVPLMKLVEVVSGAETDAGVAASLVDLAQRWGKTPVHAKSTPGFIVNRIARPFYAEALALLQEQAATPAVIDALARSAGFRMGPCELMDLIGHDVNFAVTHSVFEANFGDRRYQPSPVQQALLDGGRLGRKVGKGFYEGVPAAASGVAAGEPPELPAHIVLVGDTPLARLLWARLEARGIPFDCDSHEEWAGFRVDDVDIRITDGRSAMQVAVQSEERELALIDLPLVAVTLSDKLQPLGVAFAATTSARSRQVAIDTLRVCGWQAIEMRDVPGLWSARTVCMLINEGADAVHQGVCDEAAADAAMKLGVNWPAGPFEWLNALGVEAVVSVLDHLHEATRSERYRVSPLLQQRLWALRSERVK
jgi:3-hydroxybutyryl-CoA dehydrogenase